MGVCPNQLYHFGVPRIGTIVFLRYIYIGVLHFGSHNLGSAACLRFRGSYIWGQKLQRLFWVLTMGISSFVRLLSPFRMQVPHGGPACFCRFGIVLI